MILVETEEQLIELFGKPPEDHQISYFAAMHFLNTPQPEEPDPEK